MSVKMLNAILLSSIRQRVILLISSLLIVIMISVILLSVIPMSVIPMNVIPWTNFSLQDEPWAEFSTLEVAACIILCTYGPV